MAAEIGVGQASGGANNAQPVFNNTMSNKGPIAVPIKPDFTSDTEVLIDLSILNGFNTIDFVQTLYIDNAGNASPCIIYNGVSQQRIIARANSQGYYAFLCPNPGRFTVASAGGLPVPIELLNFPVPGVTWDATGEALTDLPLEQFSIISTADAMTGNIKTAPGTVRNIQAFNNSANIAYLKLYDDAGTPVAGAGVPTWRAMIPANVDGAGFVIDIPSGLSFVNGIAYALTGGIADDDATVVDADALLINIGFE